jgi:hypothetical protein
MKIKNILIFIILFSLTSCATFSKKITFKNQVVLNKQTISKINGVYEIKSLKSIRRFENLKPELTINDTINRYPLYTILKTNDNYGSGSNLGIENYSTKIEVQNGNKILISYLENDKITEEIILKFKIKKDGFLYLKNKNFKTKLIPGLCGNFEVQRTRIGLNSENNLIMNHSYFIYGAILFIIGDTRKTSFGSEYKRKI